MESEREKEYGHCLESSLYSKGDFPEEMLGIERLTRISQVKRWEETSMSCNVGVNHPELWGAACMLVLLE